MPLPDESASPSKGDDPAGRCSNEKCLEPVYLPDLDKPCPRCGYPVELVETKRPLHLGMILLAALVCMAAALLAAPAPVHPERDVKPETVLGSDFNGEWLMKWGSSQFRQTLDKSGFAECLGTHGTYLGSWTSARPAEVTISETFHTVPEYTKAGSEVTFTLTVKRAVRRGSKIVRLEMEGPYQGSMVKVVLTPFVFK